MRSSKYQRGLEADRRDRLLVACLMRYATASLRVVVADDDSSVRSHIRRAVDEAPDLELIGTAADGADAWRTALELNPDVLVLDDIMPIAGGLDVLARLRSERPGIRIVMYVRDPRSCLDAAELGATGCVSKSDSTEMLLSAIRAAGQAATTRR